MYKKNFLRKTLHRIFSYLPEFSLCIFGKCKTSCSAMAMEDDIKEIKSVKLKLHMSICRKCWNYYQQMKVVNESIVKNIASDLSARGVDSNKKQTVDDLISKYSK